MDAKCSNADAPRGASASRSATRNSAPRQSLPRVKILRGREHFHQVFQRGNFLRGKYFDVVSIAAEPLQAKAAFTSARNVRRAVDRIAIKRRLREAYRLEQPDVPSRVMVFVGNEKTLGAQFTDLRLQMRQILVKFSNQNRD